MSGKSICVVIPALDEAANLPTVLEAIPAEIEECEVRVVVVDDGSTDGTGQVGLSAGAKVLSHDRPEGGGRSIRDGIEAALADGAEVIVTMDADGQHLPIDLATVVWPVLQGQLDLVNGSRVLGYHDRGHWLRQLGIVLFSAFASVLMLRRVTDLSSGYRAFTADCAGAVKPRQAQFHAPDTYIRAWRLGFRVGEAPITVIPRSYGTSKKPSNLRYGWGFFKAILKARFGSP